MGLRIASWNIEGRLTAYQKRGSRGTPKRIVEELVKLDADIIVLPEAYLDHPADGVDTQLRELGYGWSDTDYHDTEHDEDIRQWGRPHLRVLYRVPVKDVTLHRWGDMRDLLTLVATDPETNKDVCLIPIHLDDLTDERRLKQVDDIVLFIRNNPLPVVMLGDFNAMWHEGRAHLLTSRIARVATSYALRGEINHVMSRLSEMATGRIMQKLKDDAHLRDIDTERRPTTTPKMRGMPHMPSIRLVQIDHILVPRGIHADPVVIGRDGGSDHRSLLTTIHVVGQMTLVDQRSIIKT